MLLETISNTLGSVIGYVGQTVTAVISGDLASLLPVVCLGIAVSVLSFGIKTIKRLTWGM